MSAKLRGRRRGARARVRRPRARGRAEASGGGAIGDFERSLHHNVRAVVVNLAADVASTIRLGCFGHDLTLDVRPIAAWLDTLTTDELRRRRRGAAAAVRRGARRRFRRGDPPGRVRERVLRAGRRRADVLSTVTVFGFYSVVLDYVLADVALSVLDADMDVALRRDPE